MTPKEFTELEKAIEQLSYSVIKASKGLNKTFEQIANCLVDVNSALNESAKKGKERAEKEEMLSSIADVLEEQKRNRIYRLGAKKSDPLVVELNKDNIHILDKCFYETTKERFSQTLNCRCSMIPIVKEPVKDDHRFELGERIQYCDYSEPVISVKQGKIGIIRDDGVVERNVSGLNIHRIKEYEPREGCTVFVKFLGSVLIGRIVDIKSRLLEESVYSVKLSDSVRSEPIKVLRASIKEYDPSKEGLEWDEIDPIGEPEEPEETDDEWHPRAGDKVFVRFEHLALPGRITKAERKHFKPSVEDLYTVEYNSKHPVKVRINRIKKYDPRKERFFSPYTIWEDL